MLSRELGRYSVAFFLFLLSSSSSSITDKRSYLNQLRNDDMSVASPSFVVTSSSSRKNKPIGRLPEVRFSEGISGAFFASSTANDLKFELRSLWLSPVAVLVRERGNF